MRFGIIAFMYTLLLDILVFYSFSMRQNEVIYEFEQRQQDIQVNYAVDAATWMMLYDTPDIDIDYTQFSEIRVSPEVALETYKAVMVRGMGWGDSDLTRAHFESVYMPFFIVAAYDGYYVYGVNRDIHEMTMMDGRDFTATEYPKIWSPKIPYAEYFGADPNNPDENIEYINIYSLGNDHYERINLASNSTSVLEYANMTPDTSDDSINARTVHRDLLVSTELTDACQTALFAAKTNYDTEQIIIPSSFSEWSSNRPVEYPTVLTYMDVAGDMTKYNHVSFAIGGSRIEEGNYFISYINEQGDRCYSKARFRNDVESVRGLEILEVYTSAIECAENGYYFDVVYLNE